MMNTPKLSLITALIIFLSAVVVFAGDWQSKFDFHGAISGYMPTSGELTDEAVGAGLLKATVIYKLNPIFRLEGSIAAGALNTVELGNPELFAMNLNTSYPLLQKADWNLRILGGIGFYSIPGLTSGAEKNLSSSGIDLGFRYERAFIPRSSLFVETLWHYWVEEDAFSPNLYAGTASVVEISVGMSFSLHPGRELQPLPPTRPRIAVKKPTDESGDSGEIPDNGSRTPITPKEVEGMSYSVDKDMDGVPDYMDFSPNTPYGLTVDSQGRPADSDGDGVPDFRDRQPNTPKDAPVDKFGRMLDSDNDGVPDKLDKDNRTPFWVAVDQDGLALLKVPEGIMKSIRFVKGKSTFYPGANIKLLLEAMQANPDVRIELRGYTDSSGSQRKNLILSQARAEAVKQFLTNNGISPDRIIAKGFGASNFIYSQNTRSPENRRIEVVIID